MENSRKQIRFRRKLTAAGCNIKNQALAVSAESVAKASARHPDQSVGIEAASVSVGMTGPPTACR
jgi:hypothetical protein